MEKIDKSAEDIERELIKNEAMDKYPDTARNGLSFPDYNSTQRMAYINGIITERTRAAQQLSEYKEVIKELLPLAQNFASTLRWDEEYSGDEVGGKEAQEIVDRAKALLQGSNQGQPQPE